MEVIWRCPPVSVTGRARLPPRRFFSVSLWGRVGVRGCSVSAGASPSHGAAVSASSAAREIEDVQLAALIDAAVAIEVELDARRSQRSAIETFVQIGAHRVIARR